MCIALEPKFYIAGTGAVGPEDSYLVTSKGLICLTESSKIIIEI
jgi:Xaa-Pro aminopeptidase